MNLNIVLFAILFFSCICASYADLANVTAEFKFNCRKKIPANDNSLIDSLYWIFSYQANVTCATYTSLPSRREYDVTFTNGTVGHFVRNEVQRVVFNDTTHIYYVALGNLTGTCEGAIVGQIRAVPRKDLDRCTAGECILTQVVSDYIILSILGGGCGVNICFGVQTQTFNDGAGIE